MLKFVVTALFRTHSSVYVMGAMSFHAHTALTVNLNVDLSLNNETSGFKQD